MMKRRVIELIASIGNKPHAVIKRSVMPGPVITSLKSVKSH